MRLKNVSYRNLQEEISSNFSKREKISWRMTLNLVHCHVESHSSRFAHRLVSFYPFGRQFGKACLLLKKSSCNYSFLLFLTKMIKLSYENDE